MSLDARGVTRSRWWSWLAIVGHFARVIYLRDHVTSADEWILLLPFPLSPSPSIAMALLVSQCNRSADAGTVTANYVFHANEYILLMNVWHVQMKKWPLLVNLHTHAHMICRKENITFITSINNSPPFTLPLPLSLSPTLNDTMFCRCSHSLTSCAVDMQCRWNCCVHRSTHQLSVNSTTRDTHFLGSSVTSSSSSSCSLRWHCTNLKTLLNAFIVIRTDIDVHECHTQRS